MATTCIAAGTTVLRVLRARHAPEVPLLRRTGWVEDPISLKLMEKNQNTNPFKYIVYAGRLGLQTPQLQLPRAQ